MVRLTKHGSEHMEENSVSNIEGNQDLPANELIDGEESHLQ